MANVTAAMVKELREMTGAGMMECKKALVEADGDMDGAVDVLRTRGIAKAAKKAGRATNEGVVACHICEKQGSAGIVEVNCETDFVSGTDKYKAFTDTIAKTVAMNDITGVDDLMEKPCGDFATVKEAMTDAIHVFGENMQIARAARIVPGDNCAVMSYIHMGGKIGVLCELQLADKANAANDAYIQAAKDVCMQIAATDPVAVDEESVPADVRQHEFEIYKAQAAESGKPENIQAKIAEGRMHKFYKESCLVEQDFVKDADKSVKQYLAEVSKAIGDDIKVKSFIRYKLGETF